MRVIETQYPELSGPHSFVRSVTKFTEFHWKVFI